MSEFRVNRVLSAPLTRVLLKTPLTPNQITLLSLGFGVLCGYFLSQGNYWLSLAAAACYQMAVLLDNCDGEVARAKNMRSKLGGWLDLFADLVTDLSLFSGAALGMKRVGADGPIDLFWGLCLSGAFIHCALVVFEKLRGFGPAVFSAPHPEHEKRQNTWRTLFDAVREGEASWLVIFLCVIGQSQVLLWGGGVYMQALWVSALVLNFCWLFHTGKKTRA